MTPDSLPLNERTPLWCALALANRGWKVFPIAPGTKKPMGSLAPNGFQSASNDHGQLRKWWEACPEAGVGLALKDSGLVCVDVDPRNGGLVTFEALEAQHGKIESDVMAYTPGGGMHFVFAAQLVGNLPGKLGLGVDLKADGYICVEPTIHPNGGTYAWEASSDPMEGCMPSALPGWIRDLARTPLQAPAMVVSTVSPMAPERRQSLIQALEHVEADTRESWLQVGMAINNELPNAEGFDLWTQWSQRSPKFDARDQLRVWRSFEPKGLAGVGVNSIFKMAQLAGWRNESSANKPGALAPAAAAALPLVFAEDIRLDQIRMDQLVEDLVHQGSMVVVYGESNSGKSFLMVDLACAIGAGQGWLGKRTVQGPVVYIAGEGAESIKLRVVAWRQHHGVEPQLAVVPVAVNLLDAAADVAKIVAACQAVASHYGKPPSMVVVDTLARAMGGGNENAAEDMGAVVANADAVRQATGATLAFVHHAGKDAGKGSRGHSSLKAATDTEIEVSGDEDTKLHTAKVTKQRDLSSRGAELVARFRAVEMATDQWGKPVTTCVVEPSDEAAPVKRVASKSKGKELERDMVALLQFEAAPTHTMRRAEIAGRLALMGHSTSSIYRGMDRLLAQGVLTNVGEMVHLVGAGFKNSR